jgi:hypothetical protein
MTSPLTTMSILGMTIELCTTFTERGHLPSRKGHGPFSESGLPSLQISSVHFAHMTTHFHPQEGHEAACTWDNT